MRPAVRADNACIVRWVSLLPCLALLGNATLCKPSQSRLTPCQLSQRESQVSVDGSLRTVFWLVLFGRFRRSSSDPATPGHLPPGGRVCGVPPLAMAGLLLWRLSHTFGCHPVRHMAECRGKTDCTTGIPFGPTVASLLRNDGGESTTPARTKPSGSGKCRIATHPARIVSGDSPPIPSKARQSRFPMHRARSGCPPCGPRISRRPCRPCVCGGGAAAGEQAA